jgi:hypothetical protein
MSPSSEQSSRSETLSEPEKNVPWTTWPSKLTRKLKASVPSRNAEGWPARTRKRRSEESVKGEASPSEVRCEAQDP